VPRVAIIFTGGTISMRHDAAAGGNVPTLTGEDLLATVPEIADVADVVPIDLGLTPASHFQLPKLFEISAAAEAALARPEVAAALVTDAALLDLDLTELTYG
jgi:L-asparaginase